MTSRERGRHDDGVTPARLEEGFAMTGRFARFRPRQRPSTPARLLASELTDFLKRYRSDAEASLAKPFKGITTDGRVVPGLFTIDKTGISTQPVRDAADAFLASLSPQQKAQARSPVEGDAWRRWSNIHPFVMRHGVSLDEMSPAQRDGALALLRASLSVKGFGTARDVMKLNEVIREITGKDDEYGEWLYWLSIMGTPSAAEPWGWQIDGHHLIVNCFVLGDQIVMTPMFMGSEPSPVVLIEFDHQRGIALDNDEPSRHHIHTVVRTPNGNDYGRDLLRQHHEQFDHTRPGLPHSHAHAGRSGPRCP
jgi:hypothetical protein